jgi:beta-glucosidase
VPVTSVDWPVQPDGLRQLLVGLRATYPSLPPVYITENGAAYDDEVSADGTVDDPLRVSYLHRHLLALREAISAGVDVRGYFVWTLMDNFEWAEGYAKRFGIVYVDYADQRRVPKSSAHWLARVARTNTVPAR